MIEKYAIKKVFSARFMPLSALNHLKNFWKGQDFISWLVYPFDFNDDNESVSDYLLKNGAEKGEVVILTLF